jgi:hypothetical protein
MKTQAWGWLVAAVLAAGLNASYHDGGLEWAHRIADRVEHNSAAVLALASGRADQFLAEARLVTDQVAAHQDETPSCPWAAAVAGVQSRVQNRVGRSDSQIARFEAISDREQARMARLEANRARIEVRLAAQTARLRAAEAAFEPAMLETVKIPDTCQRLRINIPQPPKIQLQAPVIHIAVPSAGPV